MQIETFLLTEKDRQIIRLLQEDLPLCPNPYQVLAEKLAIPEEELMLTINRYLEAGLLRRLGAVLKHQQAGFDCNVLVVWQVPPQQVMEVGKKLASFSQVSHCYQRPTYPEWPYNLFSMLHATSPEECERTILQISQAIGIKEYLPLYSLKELKKISMRYFEE